jgi:hypothetical protein
MPTVVATFSGLAVLRLLCVAAFAQHAAWAPFQYIKQSM